MELTQLSGLNVFVLFVVNLERQQIIDANIFYRLGLNNGFFKEKNYYKFSLLVYFSIQDLERSLYLFNQYSEFSLDQGGSPSMAATMYGVRSFFFSAVVVILFACRYGGATAADRGYIKYKDPKAAVEERVEDLLIRMTLPEKLGQMCQVDRFNFSVNNDEKSRIEIFTKHMIGMWYNILLYIQILI